MYKASCNLLDISYRNVHRELWALMEDILICMSVLGCVCIFVLYGVSVVAGEISWKT